MWSLGVKRLKTCSCYDASCLVYLVVSRMFILTVFIIIGYVVGACGLERSND